MIKAGLTLRDTEDWTPGMVVDILFYQINARQQRDQPKPPKQSQFDSF